MNLELYQSIFSDLINEKTISAALILFAKDIYKFIKSVKKPKPNKECQHIQQITNNYHNCVFNQERTRTKDDSE